MDDPTHRVHFINDIVCKIQNDTEIQDYEEIENRIFLGTVDFPSTIALETNSTYGNFLDNSDPLEEIIRCGFDSQFTVTWANSGIKEIVSAQDENV